jgi:hypothetical protein
MTDVNAIRRLAPHYIGAPSTGLTPVEMKNFIAGTFTTSEEQLAVLARLMQLERRER